MKSARRSEDVERDDVRSGEEHKSEARTSKEPDSFYLQRRAGNAATARLFAQGTGRPVQAELVVGDPDDEYEREADRVANAIMQDGGPRTGDAGRDQTAGITGNGGEVGSVQPRADNDEAAGMPAPTSVERALKSPGAPMQSGVKSEMEASLGASFSDVQIHQGPAAETATQEIAAHAFTVGKDIVFAPGLYAPSTKDGRRLLAHELTHVVQQTGERARRRAVQREGEEGAKGTVTVIEGVAEPVVAAGPDEPARSLYMELRDPGLAKERAELAATASNALELGRWAQKTATKLADGETVAGANFHLRMKQLSALDAAFKLKNLAAAEELNGLTGITNLIKGGLTITEGAVAGITQVVGAAIKLTRNAEYIAQAGEMITMVNKGLGHLGLLTSFVSTLHGFAQIIEGDENEKFEGAVGVSTGTLGIAGAIAKLKSIAAGEATAAGAKWAARAGSLGILSFAIEVEIQKWKLVAKHIYGESLTAFTAAGVLPHYQRLRTDLQQLASVSFDLHHWIEVRNEAVVGNTPEDEIKVGQAEEGIRKTLPPVQRALYALIQDVQHMPTRMREPFIANKDLLEDWKTAMMDSGLDLIVVPDAALRAAEATFDIGGQLVKDFEAVLKATAKERADQFHGR